MKKYICGRQQYTLLPELAATEVAKCVHYMITIALVWSCLSFLNSTTRTRRLCPRLDQTHGQNPYMLRLNEQVYDQTKSADLSETRANLTGLCRRPGRRPGSPTKSGRVALVEFGQKRRWWQMWLLMWECIHQVTAVTVSYTVSQNTTLLHYPVTPTNPIKY